MGLKYLHTMVRVKDLETSMAFYELLGLRETRRWEFGTGAFYQRFHGRPGARRLPARADL